MAGFDLNSTKQTTMNAKSIKEEPKEKGLVGMFNR